jgi:YidC/Oxa1 family membrane protein insertase
MDQQGRRNRLITIFILYMGVILWIQFMMPRGKPPEAVGTIVEQARKLDEEGRKADPNVALSDRKKKLEEAAARYEQVYNDNKNRPEGFQARFQQVNIYGYLAALEGDRAGTHWYDQAETRLKDMEKALHGKTGEVKLEISRKEGDRVVTTVETKSGDLSAIATARLNEIRAARDIVNRSKWTYRVLDWLVKLAGGKENAAFSYALALAIVVVVLKTLTFPFQKKQYQSQRDMMRVGPLIKEMQEKMKGRPPAEVNARMMQIYKENNVNLAAGCLPMLVMMIVLFPVFWMVRDYEYQFTNATFLWIGSDYARTQWWLGDNLAQFDVPLFVIYLLSTVAFSLLQPKPADPQQAQQQKMMMIMMPVMFGFMMWWGQWSSAFMLYWLVLNLVSMYQSWVLMRQLGMNVPQGSAPLPTAAEAEAPQPLAPMKGVHTAKPNKGRGQRGVAGRVGPRRAK